MPSGRPLVLLPFVSETPKSVSKLDDALLVPAHLPKSGSLLGTLCCWALSPLPSPTAAVVPSACWHRILSEKGHCPRPFPKPKEQLVSPGRGRLRPAPSAPSQRSAALGDRHGGAVSCRTPLHRQHVGSPEQLIGRQSAPFPPAFV